MSINRDFKGVWIPKAIWLDKELGWSEKLVLVEIDSLMSLGECYASNKYFSEFFDLSLDRISKIISSLVKKGKITVNLIYKEGTNQIEKRVIKSAPIPAKTPIPSRRKSREGIGEKADTPIVENAEDINTSYINTMNNTININKEDVSTSLNSNTNNQEKKNQQPLNIGYDIKKSIGDRETQKEFPINKPIEKIIDDILSFSNPKQDAKYRYNPTFIQHCIDYCNVKKTFSQYKRRVDTMATDTMVLQGVLSTLDPYTPSEIIQAIDTYTEIKNRSNEYKLFPAYGSPITFFTADSGIIKFADREQALISCKLSPQEIEKIKEKERVAEEERVLEKIYGGR
jgi:hypothetical protein